MTEEPPDKYSPYGGTGPTEGYPSYGPQSGGYTPPPPSPNPYGGYPPYPPSPQPYGSYPPQGPYGQPVKPNNHLAWSIVTIFLCFIPGVVATIYASQVDGLWAQGRWAEANKSSNNAKSWAIVASVFGGLFVLSWLGRVASHVS